MSILVPIHNNEHTVGAVVDGIVACLEGSGRTYELILVDDASRDGSWDVISQRAGRHDTVRGVRLQRNVGGGTARAAGCAHARGRYICTIDADGDDDPADLLRVLEALEAGNQFVSGVRLDSKGRPPTRRIGSFLMRKLLAATWDFVPRDLGCGVQGWDADLVPGALEYLPTRRDFAWAIPLFEPVTSYAEVEIHSHRGGRSSYGFLRQVGRLSALALEVWRGLAVALLMGGASVIGISMVAASGAVVWLMLGGPLWPLITCGSSFAVLGLPMLLTGLVLVSLDRLRDAATPAYLVADEI